MKKHLLLITLVIVFAGCGNKTTNQKSQDTIVSNAIVVDNTIQTQEDAANNVVPQDFEQFVSLYKELLDFKNRADFKQYGFGQGGPYYAWLERANSLVNTANVSHFSQYGFVPADLTALGNNYVASKGIDNDATMVLRSAIDKGIAKANGVEQASTNEEVVPVTNDEKVIGHWKLSGALNYDIKIVQQGKQYVSMENGKRIKLTLKGDKYYLDNSKTGEYYKITNGNLRLCDKDGDFTDTFNIRVEKLK